MGICGNGETRSSASRLKYAIMQDSGTLSLGVPNVYTPKDRRAALSSLELNLGLFLSLTETLEVLTKLKNLNVDRLIH